MKTIVLDNGHGKETEGKRSPEWDKGILLEYAFNRDIVKRIKEILDSTGINCVVLVPELNDVSLSERVSRANKIDNSVLVSIHANAGGGEGYELFTSKGETKSDEYASMILDEIKKSFPEWRMRGVKEENFYILKNTRQPAILCELGFMDSQADYDRLMSEEFRRRLAVAHANALIKIARL